MGTRTVSGSKGPQRATGHLLKGTTHRGAFGKSGQSGVEAFSWWRPWVLNVLQGTGQARGTRTCLPQAGEAGQTDVALVVAAGSGGHPNSGSTAEGPTQISALSDPPLRPPDTRHCRPWIPTTGALRSAFVMKVWLPLHVHSSPFTERQQCSLRWELTSSEGLGLTGPHTILSP